MKRHTLLAAALAVAALAAACLAAAASAAPPEELIQFPADGATGSGAGRLDNPRGMAVDPATGHVYVADRRNARISEFSAWGVFVKAFGWGVRDGSPELQTCGPGATPPIAACQKGIAGTEAGQFEFLLGGIAVGAAGDLYAGDMENLRIQKFDAEGNFLLMFGGEVNRTTGADVCTKADVEGGEECGAGIAGTGDAEFSTGSVGAFLALSPDGETVYVGDRERIQEFDPDGSFKGVLPDPEGLLAGETVHSLAVDPTSGDLYASIRGTEADPGGDVLRLSATSGAAVATLPAEHPGALAVDSEGNVYVVEDRPGFGHPGVPGLELEPRVLMFDPSGNCLVCGAEGEDGEDGFDIPKDGTSLPALATSSACEAASDTLYVSHFRTGTLSYVRAFGPPPQDVVKCPPPPPEPPEIDDQFAISVGTDWARLGATINPNFALDATYHLEYGTAPCAEGGCAAQPAPPGRSLTAKVSQKPLAAEPIALSGLEPGRTYHYRFVAQSAGSAGQPVKGLGGEVGAEGAEGTFTTFPLPPPPRTDCPNQARRNGPSAHLPDCRAYEMVSPPDKNGSDIRTSFTLIGSPARLDLASTGGERFTYSSEQAFGDAVSAPFSNQYLATRTAGGWANHGIAAPRDPEQIAGSATTKFDVEFKAFGPDLCQGWLVHTSPRLQAPGAVPGHLNLYRRSNCGPGADSYEALSTVPPAATAPSAYNFELQGLSAEGSHAVFAANGKLAVESGPEASGATHGDGSPIFQLYEAHPGGLRLVSVLPGGEASEATSMAGTGSDFGEGRSASVAGAVSADGSRIYWSSEGALYLRSQGEETVKVSAAPATFWAASPDGARALFTRSGALFLYDAEAGKSSLIAVGVEGVTAAGADAASAYFVSLAALAEGAVEGEPNLYLFRQGEPLAHVARLAAEDLSAADFRPLGVSLVSSVPYRRGARATPDGEHLAFLSSAPLSGYDNRDAASGERARELFLYDAATAELRCLSCNPTGARPSARRIQGSPSPATATLAALLPSWKNQLHAPRVISEDGERVFFESFEALLPRDTNGVTDVYEWQRGDAQSCRRAGAELHVPASGGCLSLISSGKGQLDAELLDATPDGSDVFFKTAASLAPQDPGLIDVYDARAGGGFPPPAEPAAACEGEACAPPAAAPEDPTPASASFLGPANAAAPRPSCATAARRAKRKAARARALRRAVRRAGAPRRARALRAKARRSARRARRLAGEARRCRAARKAGPKRGRRR